MLSEKDFNFHVGCKNEKKRLQKNAYKKYLEGLRVGGEAHMDINEISTDIISLAKETSSKLGISVNEFIERSIITAHDLWEGYSNAKLKYPVQAQHIDLARISSEITKKLRDNGFSNWLTGGTLISAIRDNDLFLPWSISVTIGVINDSTPCGFDWNQIAQEVRDAIISEYEIVNWDKINAKTSILCKICCKSLPRLSDNDTHSIGIFFSSESNIVAVSEDEGKIRTYMQDIAGKTGTITSKMLEVHIYRKEVGENGETLIRSGRHPKGNTLVPVKWILPTNPFYFQDLMFSVPAESEKFLDFTLSKSWVTPIRGIHSFRGEMTSEAIPDMKKFRYLPRFLDVNK